MKDNPAQLTLPITNSAGSITNQGYQCFSQT